MTRATITIVGVVVLLGTTCYSVAYVKTTKEIIQESIEELIAIKDDTTLAVATKEARELESAKATLQKIVEVSHEEIKLFQKKLNGLAIEQLVTDDYTFDAAAITGTLNGLLTYYNAYHTETLKNVEKATQQDETQKIASDLEVWRSTVYNPGIQIIFSIELVLNQKNSLKIGNNRFEKILNDLRRLKNNKLITLVELDPLLRRATANQKIANALGADATMLLLQTLRNLNDDNRNVIAATNYKKIKNIAEQLFMNVRDMYKQFMEINKKVQVMLQG